MRARTYTWWEHDKHGFGGGRLTSNEVYITLDPVQIKSWKFGNALIIPDVIEQARGMRRFPRYSLSMAVFLIC